MREIRASAAAAAVSLHLHVVVIASRAAGAVLAAFLIPELGRGAPERVDESRVAVRHAVHDGETGAAESTTNHDHAAHVTSICSIPGARTTACTNMTTRPRMSAAQNTAMPLSDQNRPRLFAARSCRLARNHRATCAPSPSRAASPSDPPRRARRAAADPGLRQHVRRLRFTADGRPVQRRASFLIRARDVRVAKQRSLVASGKPLYAAQCSGDRPSLSCVSTSAFHRILKW